MRLATVAVFIALVLLSVAAGKVILHPRPHYAGWTVVIELSVLAVCALHCLVNMRRGD